MLRELTLENFKAFKERAVMPMAPITLIFGENSAGKSTILQALALLKQSWEERSTEQLLLFKPRHPIVDLGSYEEAVYGHNVELPITVGLALGREQDVYRLEFEFHHDPETKNARLVQAAIPVNEREALARFEWVSSPEGYIAHLERLFFEVESGTTGAFRGSELTRSEIHWKRAYDAVKRSQSQIPNRFQPGPLSFDTETGEFTSYDGPFIFMDHIPQAILDRSFTIEDYIDWVASCFEESFVEFQGLFRPGRIVGSLPVASFANPSVMLRSGCAALGSMLEALIPLGPIRSGPRRWYELYRMAVEDVGYEGGFAPQLLLKREDDRQRVNHWLQKLDMGYELVVKPLSSDLFELRLVDLRSSDRVEVSLASVGYGVSQVLPVITQSVIARSSVITIEQPELHIHPRLQAELGDLLAEGIKAPYHNQFIIETHSEHLILRLQRLVRTGVLSPQDISVLYVLRGKEGSGSQVIPLRLDEEGDFLDEWPGGFFPERLKELL